MTSRARVGATLVALAATATAALLLGAPAQAAPGATQAPTRTTLSASPSTIAFGATAHLKAVVKPVVGAGKPTGTVTFSEGATVVGTVSLALVGTVETAKMDVPGLAIGDHDFTATYNGSATFASSTSLPLTVTVGPAASVTTLSASSLTIAWKQPAKLKATVKAKVAGTGTPAGSVTFNEGATELGSAPLALVGTVWTAKLTVSGLSIGDHVLTATFVPSGGSLDGSTSSPKTLTVTKVPVAITVTSTQNLDGTYFFTAQVKGTVTGAGNPTQPDTVTFFIDAFAPQTYALGASGKADTSSQPVSLDAGSHTVKVTFTPAAGSIFVAGQTTVTFTI